MKIAYFTTAQDNDEYLKSKIEINPSNQVFHTNLIECLSLSNSLNVFSCRSNIFGNKEAYSKKINNVSWDYLKTRKNKFFNLFSQITNSKKSKEKCPIAFVDALNIRCLLAAKAYAKKNKIPLIGIVTDNPYSLNDANIKASLRLLKAAKECDAFICLTEALNTLFNKDKKPYVIVKGLSKQTNKNSTPVDYPYFFFAGALLKKYGIFNLINAFKSFKDENVKLVIAGHNNNDELRSIIENNSRIEFLGKISNEEVLRYENNSIANINPRPFMEEIDKYSIPSKVIEYSSKNSLIISGYSSELKEIFNDSIFWVDEKNTLDKRLLEVYKLDIKTREEMISKTKTICEKEFSFKSVNKKLEDFLSKIIH